MAFKIGTGETIIEDDADVRLNYVDSINNVTFEDGHITMDLSKGNLFRMPDLWGPTGEVKDNPFLAAGINGILPQKAKLKFKNWPEPGEVKRVALIQEHVPRFDPRTSLDTSGFTQMMSEQDSSKYKFEYFDCNKTGEYVLSKKTISSGAASGGVYLVRHDMSTPNDLQTLGTTFGDAAQTVKFYPGFLDSSDEATVNSNHERFFWNGNGTAIYMNNLEDDTFVKFPLTTKWDLTTVDKTSIVTTDYTAYTSNVSPNLKMPVFANNGYYLFAMDYALSGTGSNAYGIQSFRMSTPYDLDTIYEGKWFQVGNGVISYPQSILVEPNGEYIWITNLDETKRIRMTSGYAFDLDNVGYTVSTDDLPKSGGGTLNQNPENVRFAQFTGTRGQTLMHLETGGTGYISDRRMFLTDNRTKYNSLPITGAMFNYLSDSNDIQDYENWSGFWERTWQPVDNKIKVADKFVRSDSSAGYGTIGELEYPYPDGVNYYEFLVFDSSEGAVLTNFQKGRGNGPGWNSNGNYNIAGEAVFTEPGLYKFYFPAGVTAFSAVCIGGGAGGASGTFNVVSTPGDATTGTGGAGGGGGMLAYRNNLSVQSHGYCWIRVGAGGALPHYGNVDWTTNEQNAGGDSFIETTSTSLIFYTPEVRARGGAVSGGSQSSGSGTNFAKGGKGGRVLSTITYGGVQMAGGGGGGGAGGYIYYNNDFNGKGGDFYQFASGSYYPRAGDYQSSGDGGGGGGAGAYYAPTAYVSPGVPGGGTNIYGTKYKRLTATTQEKISGDAGENGTSGNYSTSNPNFRSPIQGGAGAYLLGGSTRTDYGAGGGGNKFTPNTGSNNGQISGATAGADGAVRIVWGNANLTREFPSTNVGHEQSAVIYSNVGKTSL